MEEKIEFDLDLYKTGKYDVITREDEPVEIKFTDGRDPYPIAGYLGDNDITFKWTENGRYLLRGKAGYDLLLVEKEQPVEQPKEQPEEINEALVWAAMAAVGGVSIDWTPNGYRFHSYALNVDITAPTPYAVAVELYKKLKGE